MAMSMYRTKTATIDMAQIIGTLSDDGSTITYYDENEEEQTITVSEFLNTFCGKNIEMSVFEKVMQD